jgi:hypothetical protein
VLIAAAELQSYLPAELTTRAEQASNELALPPDPARASGGTDPYPAPDRRLRPGPSSRADRPRRAGIKRAPLLKRLLMLQAQNARRAQRAQNFRPSLPSGTCPDGGASQPPAGSNGGLPAAGLRNGATRAQTA